MTFTRRTRRTRRPSRVRGVLAGTALAVLATAAPAPAAAPPPTPQVVAADDVGAVADQVADAQVVAVGESAHSIHEAFAFKSRLMRELVTHHGYTTVALEVGWSTGRRLDRYVLHGAGDPRQILRTDLQGEYRLWNTAEHVAMLRWLRRWNARAEVPVRVVGIDLGYPGRATFTPITRLARTLPEPGRRRVARLVARLRPSDATSVGTWMATQRAAPAARRHGDARAAHALLRLVRRSGADGWVVQHARQVERSFAAYGIDDADFPGRMRLRDRSMADTLTWWVERNASRAVLFGANAHMALRPEDPATFPLSAGGVLRGRWGDAYVPIGMTIGRGSLRVYPDPLAGEPRVFRVGPPPRGSNEHRLERGTRGDVVLDLREESHGWERARPTRSYGLYWSERPPSVSLARSYDLVLHVRRFGPGRLLPSAGR